MSTYNKLYVYRVPWDRVGDSMSSLFFQNTEENALQAIKLWMDQVFQSHDDRLAAAEYISVTIVEKEGQGMACISVPTATIIKKLKILYAD